MTDPSGARDESLDLSNLGNPVDPRREDQDLDLDDDVELREKGEKALREERKRARSFRAELIRLGYTISKDGTVLPPSNGASTQLTDIDEDSIRKSVREEADREWSTKLIRVEAKAELVAAGFKGDPTRGARMLDLDDVDPGDSESLQEAITDLKENSPNLFKRSRTREEDDEEDEQNGQARRRVPSADQGKRLSNVTQKDPASLFGSFRKSNGWD